MKNLLCILTALALAFPLGAQSIKMEAPNLVADDEQFNVTFTIDGEKAPSDFQWSPGEDFKLVWGPQKGTSTVMQIVGGKASRSSTTTYTYVLMPLKAGTFTLPEASASVKGNRISSGSRTIQVVAGAQQGAASQGTSSQSAPSEGSAGTISSEDIYMKLLLSSSSAVVGEGITATLKLYQRVNIAGFEDAKFPTFDGFWSQELQAPSNIEFRRENVGGAIYNTAVLRSWNLTAQRAGELVIDPAELVCLVNVRQPSSGGGSIFDSFFQDDYRTIRKRVSTPPVTIHVKALPTPAPASFGGGVGKFSMRAELSTDSLKTHDAASLRITISGNGNVALLEAPKVHFPPDFEVYDVKSSDARGGKVFEFPFIPRTYGDYEIGPVEYSYYDIENARYVTLRSNALALHVERSAAASKDGAADSGALIVSQKDVKDLGSDIRYISTRKPAFREAGRFFVWSPLFWGLTALLVLLASALYLAFRRRAVLRADVALSRNRGAVKMARKRLAAASGFLQQNLYSAFYEELHKALLGFVSDKFALDAAELSRENISSRIESAGAPAGLAGEFCELLDACEYARYAPDAGHEAMNSHYESAVSVISRIDSYMKKKPESKFTAIVLALLLLPLSAQAADYVDSLWTVGTEAYSEGRYAQARDAWLSLTSAGLSSPELYTNLADAYFKSDDLARAILYYERALKLDPSYGDARHNLRFAKTQVRDRIESVPEFFLLTWMRSLGWRLSSNSWALLSMLLFAAFLAMLLLYLLGRRPASKKAGFYSGIALLLLSAGALAFASWQKRDFLRQDEAVVTAPVVSVKSAPGAGEAKDLFILHEGTELRILDSVGEWLNVELADGRQGWMRSENLEKF